MKTATNEMAPHFRKAVLEIDSDIAGLHQDIARLQITRGTIVELYGGGVDLPVLAVQTIGKPAREDARPTAEKPKRAYKKRAVTATNGGGHPPALDVRSTAKVKAPAVPAQSTAARLSEKPDTLGGAMKLLANRLKKFCISDMVRELNADADFAALLEAASDTTLYGNLAYWSKTGKLTKTGEGADASYTVVNL